MISERGCMCQDPVGSRINLGWFRWRCFIEGTTCRAVDRIPVHRDWLSNGGEAFKDISNRKPLRLLGLKKQRKRIVLFEKVRVPAVEEQLSRTHMPRWAQLLQRGRGQELPQPLFLPAPWTPGRASHWENPAEGQRSSQEAVHRHQFPGPQSRTEKGKEWWEQRSNKNNEFTRGDYVIQWAESRRKAHIESPAQSLFLLLWTQLSEKKSG